MKKLLAIIIAVLLLAALVLVFVFSSHVDDSPLPKATPVAIPKVTPTPTPVAPITFPSDIPVVAGKVTITGVLNSSAKSMGINTPATSGFVLNVFIGKGSSNAVAILTTHGYSLKTDTGIDSPSDYYTNGKYDIEVNTNIVSASNIPNTPNGNYVEYFAFAVAPIGAGN
jgi:hypothetical protein